MPRRAKPVGVRSISDTVPPENRTLGWQVLAWTAEYLLQPDGPNAGLPWEFTPEQARIVLRWYAVDEHGRFLFRRGVMRRQKGWGKDPFLAALSGVELCGPCRFGGWDSKNLPVAIQHPAPWIQVAAVSKDQTRNTMTLFPGMFSKDAMSEYKIDLGKEIIYARGSGRIEAVTSSPRALEGGRPSLVVLNESHHWLDNNDGIEMAQAINRNLGKSRDGAARAMEITNAHLPGEGSVAELTYDAWRAANGRVPGLYYDSLEAPEIKDIDDQVAVRNGLLAARGDSLWVDVDRVLEEINDPVTPEWLARRFYLNQVVKAGGEKWISDEAWNQCADAERVINDGEEVVLGFDGSYSNDSTALVVVPMDGVPHLDVVGVWEKKPTDTPEWRAPRLDIMETIRKACDRWKVREITCDPHIWVSELEQLVEEGLPVVVFEQKGSRLMPATQRFREMVLGKELTHSGNEDLARHIGNAMPKTDARGTQLTKDPRRRAKIDLAVASLMALHRQAELQPEGPPSVWNLTDFAEEIRRERAGLPAPEPTDPPPEPPAGGQRFVPLGEMPRR